MTKFYQNKCKRLEAKNKRLQKEVEAVEKEKEYILADKEALRLRILTSQDTLNLMRDDLHKIKSVMYDFMKDKMYGKT